MTIEIYAQDGVNVKEGDTFSAFAGKCCRQTYGNSSYVKIHDFSRGHFRGPRGFEVRHLLPGTCLTVAPDGIGTKVILSDAAGFHVQSGSDVLEMTAGDITRWGGLPLVHCNVLDVSSLGELNDATNNACRELMQGLMQACEKNHMVMLCGETAELGVCVGSSNPNALVKYNWAGFALGAYHHDKMILGNTLKPGQIIIALPEVGFRSNGGSTVRIAFELRFGPDWATNEQAASCLKLAAAPSVHYNAFLTKAHGWLEADFQPLYNMHLIVHVTGGSFKSKFADDVLFPQGLSAELDDLCDPPDIMKICAVWRGMSDLDCYKTWNCGQGMLVVIDKEDVQSFCSFAGKHGIQAKVAGKICQTPSGQDNQVLIKSKFNPSCELKIVQGKEMVVS